MLRHRCHTARIAAADDAFLVLQPKSHHGGVNVQPLARRKTDVERQRRHALVLRQVIEERHLLLRLERRSSSVLPHSFCALAFCTTDVFAARFCAFGLPCACCSQKKSHGEMRGARKGSGSGAGVSDWSGALDVIRAPSLFASSIRLLRWYTSILTLHEIPMAPALA